MNELRVSVVKFLSLIYSSVGDRTGIVEGMREKRRVLVVARQRSLGGRTIIITPIIQLHISVLLLYPIVIISYKTGR